MNPWLLTGLIFAGWIAVSIPIGYLLARWMGAAASSNFDRP